MGIIAKAHFYLSSQTLMTLYYSLVYPFAKVSSAVQQKLTEQIPPLYLASLKSLTYLALIRFLSLLLCHHNHLPNSFRDLFLSNNQVHQYETRLASQYRPHFCRTNITQFSILYRGPKIWKLFVAYFTN